MANHGAGSSVSVSGDWRLEITGWVRPAEALPLGFCSVQRESESALAMLHGIGIGIGKEEERPGVDPARWKRDACGVTDRRAAGCFSSMDGSGPFGHRAGSEEWWSWSGV
jgi:hypothetical protein